jgi:hypothetical protein
LPTVGFCKVARERVFGFYVVFIRKWRLRTFHNFFHFELWVLSTTAIAKKNSCLKWPWKTCK